MSKKETKLKTREELFREKASTYTVCFSTACPLREHCLRAILTGYLPADNLVTMSINLNHPQTQTDHCPMFRSDTPVRMPYGLQNLYYNMPGRMERSIKSHLISTYNRKRYYQFHNGTRPITPDVERYIRKVLKDNGWTEEPQFSGYVEDLLW